LRESFSLVMWKKNCEAEMKKFFLILIALVILPVSVLADDKSESAKKDGTFPATEIPSGKYELDNTHASIIWKVSHLGLSNYTARFTDFSAKLDFNNEDPTKSSLEVSINPLSVRTDYPNKEEKDFDKKLAEDKNWFNGLKFPAITFKSSEVVKTSENAGVVKGELTMLGVTKPLELNVTSNGGYPKKPFAEVPALGFSATTTVKRSDWGFDTYVPTIGDEVEVMIEVEFHKVD
jgi:polyisoprenoid-binding protein YceI